MLFLLLRMAGGPGGPEEKSITPAPVGALLLVTVEKTKFTVESSMEIPPPTEALFPEIVLLRRVRGKPSPL
jgi:hypothetical protein